MSFLLDTNVVSKWAKPRPNPGAVAWYAAVDEDRVFLSVATLAELRHGIQRLADGTRRRRLDAWLREELVLRFEGRLLPIDRPVADRWGELVAEREAAEKPIGLHVDGPGDRQSVDDQDVTTRLWPARGAAGSVARCPRSFLLKKPSKRSSATR